MNAIRQNIEVFRIFEEAGWMTYLQRLNGFNGGMALQFSQNLEGYHYEVGGLRVEVVEHILEKVIVFSRIEKIWFDRKAPNLKEKNISLQKEKMFNIRDEEQP